MRHRPVPVARAGAALVLALLLAVPVLLTTAAPAHACRCAPSSVAQQARAADMVVSGSVVDVRDEPAVRQDQDRRSPPAQRNRRDRGGSGQDPARFGTVTLVVEVDRIYSGMIPDPTIEVTTALQASACGLGALPTDRRYFFFLTEDDTVLRATSCDGTGPATARQARAVEAAVGQGRTVAAEDAAPVVERTLVDGSETPSLVRTAAPGGVLAALGLIGLLVLGGVGSRR